MSITRIRQIIFKAGGSISCIGSVYIIQDVLRHPDKRSKSIYHRIMIGLSIMDILLSFFAHVLSSWPMPKGSYLWAVGNVASCDAAAFIGRIGYLGSPLYNCSLASYYSLQLKYNWTDHRMKQAEKWFHIVPWSVSILICIAALSTKSLGPSGAGYCAGTIGYPLGCNRPGSEVECIRGGRMVNRIFAIIRVTIPLICVLFVSITMFRVYTSVRKVEKDALKHSFLSRFREQDKKRTMKRSRRVMIQGILYCAAMILTWIFVFINVITKMATNELHPSLLFLMTILNPLQGVFNFLIYMIPVSRKILKQHRQRSKRLSMLVREEPNTENDDEKNNEENVSSPTLWKSSGKTISAVVECNIENNEENHNPPTLALSPSSSSSSSSLSSGEGKITSIFVDGDCWKQAEKNNNAAAIVEEEEEKQEIQPLPPGFGLKNGKII